MAIGIETDFQIYQEQFQSGMIERVDQDVQKFGPASANCIMLVNRRTKGYYEQEAFHQALSGAIVRRDTTSVAAATDIAMTQSEIVRVKLNRRMGPITQTRDAWRKINADPKVMSFLIGQWVGEARVQDELNSAIRAGVSALAGTTANYLDASGGGDVTHTVLNDGLRLLGDRAGSIACFVMHSKVWFDLVGSAIANAMHDPIGAIAIQQGVTASLGRPVIVTDSPDLIVSGTPDNYLTLGLVSGGLEVNESEQDDVVIEPVTGLDNLVDRFQGEYAYNVGVKGFAWDIANGGANPTDAAVATTTNWDQVATSTKDTAGVAIQTT